MDSFTFSCLVENTDVSHLLFLEIIVDDQVTFSRSKIEGTQIITFDFPDIDGTHCMQLNMSGKTVLDTIIDSQGNFIKNPMLKISDIKFENINCDLIIVKSAVYTHTFNGAQPQINDIFGGYMGCSGTVSFNFSTPIYSWLLDTI